MCIRDRYMFPKAHAAAYVMMAWRVAYFKIFYPLEYYCAYFSIRANAFDYEKMALGKDKLKYYIADYKKRLETKEPVSYTHLDVYKRQDLLIRTGGDERLSNYLPWQLTYTEFYFTPVLWPAFTKNDLIDAVIKYNGRDRRFGGVK